MFSNVDLALGFQLSLFSRIKFDFKVKSNLIHFPFSKTFLLKSNLILKSNLKDFELSRSSRIKFDFTLGLHIWLRVRVLS